jgi:hypothetical protein
MESLAFVIALVVGWAILAGGALVWGVDSRPGMTDDHAR